MSRRTTTIPPSPRRATPTAWAEVVAQILGKRERHEDHVFEDARTVSTALQALVASGRAVATYPGQGVLPVTTVRTTHQAEPGLGRFRSPAKDAAASLADTAFALESDTATWIANVATLTYVAPRRGQSLDRAVFHLWLGPLKGVPFIHEQLPKALHFAGKQALLLADSDHDVEGLLRQGVDVTQAEEIGQALRGERERRGYVPPDERARKEQATAAVRAAFLAHRGPRPRALAQADIDVIVREGLAQGLLISLELVHAVTDGRGSPNAVYPKLADAMGRLAPRRPAADDVDPALRALWDTLRGDATTAATAALQPERDALAADQAALASAQAALAAEREQDARVAAERERQHQRLEAELVSARDRIESLVNIERGQAQDIARLDAEGAALRAQLQDAAASRAEVQRELAELQAAHVALQATLAQARTEAGAARDAAAAQLADATTRLAHVTALAEARHEALQQASAALPPLRTALAEAQAAAAEATRARRTVEEALAEQRVAAARERTDHAAAAAGWQERLDRLTQEAAAQERALAALDGQHRVVVRERDRLDRLLVRLRPAPEAH